MDGCNYTNTQYSNVQNFGPLITLLSWIEASVSLKSYLVNAHWLEDFDVSICETDTRMCVMHWVCGLTTQYLSTVLLCALSRSTCHPLPNEKMVSWPYYQVITILDYIIKFFLIWTYLVLLYVVFLSFFPGVESLIGNFCCKHYIIVLVERYLLLLFLIICKQFH